MATFEDWLEGEGFGRPAPNQVEVTYVNHMVAGAEATTRQPLAAFVRLWAGEPSNATGPDEVDFRCSYIMTGATDEPLGRLHLQVQSQLRRSDSVPLYSFTLVGRGAPSAPTKEAALALMDQQHNWIVRTFADVTTEGMHDKWERTR